MTPVYSFLSIAGDTMTLSTTNPADAGVYFVDVEISLPDYPMIIPIVKRIQLTIICEVLTFSFNPGIPLTQLLRIGIDP